MKITLDLSDLVARGKLTAEEADRLKQLAGEDTSAMAINILLGFGIIAVTLGVWVFVPTAIGAIALGLIVFGAGAGLRFGASAKWSIFAQICLTIGAMGLSGGLIAQFDSALWIELALVLGLAIASVLARSGLLAALGVLMLNAALGSAMAYFHAAYVFWTPHPGQTYLAWIHQMPVPRRSKHMKQEY